MCVVIHKCVPGPVPRMLLPVVPGKKKDAPFEQSSLHQLLVRVCTIDVSVPCHWVVVLQLYIIGLEEERIFRRGIRKVSRHSKPKCGGFASVFLRKQMIADV